MKSTKKARITSKVVAALLAVVMAMAFAVPAFATDWDNFDPGYTNKQGDAPLSPDVSVTVKGYVGEDGDPDGGGVTPYEINVSVPTQVMWAAFQTDAGTVTAPNYHIKNNSLTNDVEVTLLSFTAQSSSDNTAVDSALTLNLTGTQMAQAGIFTTGTGYTNNIAYGTDLVKNTQWDFSFTGNWTGTFVAGNNYNPLYTMTFKFDEV